MDTSLQSLDQIRASALDMAVRFGPKVIVAILILLAGYVVGRWVGRGLERLLVRLNLEAPVRSLLVRIVQIFVLAIFAIMALQNLGIELLPLIAGLGVAGAGIALAMQGLLGNLVAGLSIIFTRPFHLGDYISIAKEEGEVLDISLFSTTLGHADLSRVVIPNRKIVGEILHNYGQIRRLNISLGISYRADVNVALGLIADILAANPRVLKDPVPQLGVTRLAESSVSIGVCPWVNVPDYDAAISELNKTILEVFSVKNIALALPLYEVRMLVVSHDETRGYMRASLRRASWVENFHLTGMALALRSRTLAATCCRSVSSSGMRCDKHMFDRTANSISAILSQLPCLGV